MSEKKEVVKANNGLDGMVVYDGVVVEVPVTDPAGDVTYEKRNLFKIINSSYAQSKEAAMATKLNKRSEV